MAGVVSFDIDWSERLKIDKKILERAEITVSEPEPWQRIWEVALASEDVDQLKKVFLRSYGRRIELPGFRKGKIPLEMVKRQLGEEFERLVMDEIGMGLLPFLKERESLELMHGADLSFDSTGDGQHVFTVKADVVPHFDSPQYKGVKGTLRKQKIVEAEVAAFLERIRERHSRLEAKDGPLGEGDVARIRMRRVGPGGVVLIGEEDRWHTVTLKSDALPEQLLSALMGLSKGESREVKLPTDRSPYVETAPSSEGYEIYAVHVDGAFLIKAPDEEALLSIFGLDDPEEIPIRARIMLEDDAEERARKALKEELVAQIARETEIAVPPSLIKERANKFRDSLIERARSAGREPEAEWMDEGFFLDKHRESMEQIIKEFLVVDEIARAEELEATEEQFDAAIAALARENDISPKRMRKKLDEDDTESLARKITRANVESFIENEADIDVSEYSADGVLEA